MRGPAPRRAGRAPPRPAARSPGRGRQAAHVAGGQHAAAESLARRLARPRLGARDRAHLAGEPDLAPQHDVVGQRPAAHARRDRRDDGEVGGRLVDAQAARDVQEHVLIVELHAAALLEHGEQQRDAGRDRRRWRSAAAWPAPSATRAPGSRPARGGCLPASRARPSRARPRGARRGTRPTGSAPRRARSPPSRTRPPRWWSRSGSSPRAARAARARRRPRSRAPCRPGARGRAGRRARPPW